MYLETLVLYIMVNFQFINNQKEIKMKWLILLSLFACSTQKAPVSSPTESDAILVLRNWGCSRPEP